MTAWQIMNNDARWETVYRTASDCDYATCFTTDNADWLESRVLIEDTLNAGVIMAEAMK